MAQVTAADRLVVAALRAHVRPLVSAALIAATLAGAVLLTTFFAVQIGEVRLYECYARTSAPMVELL